jgi:hypothetical protein
MTVYRVTVACDHVRVTINGQEGVYGFFKNEYVRARTTEAAREAAIANVRRALVRRADVSLDDVSRIDLRVDELEPRVALWNWLRREGFVFYPHGT